MPHTNNARPVTFTAHAGSLGTVPNTRESVLAGLEYIGGGNIEVDVRFSPTGVPVLSHDAVKDTSAFTLEECFALAQPFTAGINLDLKEAQGNVAEIHRLAEAYGLLPRVFFTGIRASDVAAVRALGIPYYLNVYPGRLRARLRGANARLARKTRVLGAVGLNLPHWWTTPTLVRTAHAAGLLVSAWTVDSRTDMERLLALGVDNITTRKPDLLQTGVDT
ncbi:MAG: glycerophosphodiester phosphodiesterase [Oscillospiraceae bacterium]|jgi:glycerophosphoryl diester phosphodiesterase|nr:glycerophosphodiester phosphodiesterase [Oscillospiraceae bacterium]